MSVGLKWVSCRQHIYGYCFYIHSVGLCLLVEVFNPFTFKVIIDIYVPIWTARRSNQSILKEISPGYSLEGMMLKLKLQYFVHLMQRADSLEKTLMLGGIEGRRRRGRQDEMARWHHRLNGHEFG